MKKLTLVPIGGLANRMFAITSSICFCAENGIRLKVVWFKDWGMGADFHSLFELSNNVEDVEIRDARIWDYRYDRPRKRNLFLPSLWQLLAFDKRIYENDILNGFESDDLQTVMVSSNSVYLNDFRLFYDVPGMLNLLQPKEHIKNKINRQILKFAQTRIIGIHIRRGDHSTPTINSPLSLFTSKIEEEISFDKSTRFYVASDSQEEKQKLVDRFGSSIITSLEIVRRDTAEGIIDALVEMYTLSATQKIYGSFASSFSLVAAKISDIPIEVLSIKK